MYLEISNPIDYHAGLYIRLSKEDESEGPSQSVQNQESLLREFVQQHRLSVYDTYIDDGWSGTSFDRPAFQRMITDIEDKKVNMVIHQGSVPAGARLHHDRPLYGALFPGTPCAVHLPAGRHRHRRGVHGKRYHAVPGYHE